MELVYDRFYKLKGHLYPEREFFANLERLDRLKDERIIRENLRNYLNRTYATQNLTNTWRLMLELSSVGGFANEGEFELHTKSMVRHIAHYEYYSRLPFKREIDKIAFTNIVKILSQAHAGRFFVFRSANETFKDFVTRLHKMVTADLNNFSHFLQLLPLANVFANANQAKLGLDAKPIIDSLAAHFKTYDKELKIGEISSLLNVHNYEPFLEQKDFERIQKAITEIINDTEVENPTASLLNIAYNLKKAGKADKNLNNFLKQSSDLLLVKIDNTRDMHRFIRSANGLLNVDMASNDHIDQINRTLVDNIDKSDVNLVQYSSALLESDKVSANAKQMLEERVKSLVNQNPLKYDLTNPLVQKIIKTQD